MVVGVTNESKGLVEKAVSKNRMKFPVAMVKTPEEANYGIRGFPSSYLLDVDGTILWKGHPAGFDREYGRERLERDLMRTSVVPPAPEGHEKALEKHVEDGDFSRAYQAATGELSDHPEDESLKMFVKSIEEIVEVRMREAKLAEDDGAYAKALDIYAGLADDFEDVPGAEGASDLAKELAKSKEAKSDLSAAKKWKSAMASWRKGDFEKALKNVSSIARKYGDTATGERALDMLSRHDT